MYIQSETQSDEGTLLHLAVLRNRTDIAKIILEKGVDINTLTKNGKSVLDLLISANVGELAWVQKQYLLELLLRYRIQITALHVGNMIIYASHHIKQSIVKMIELMPVSEMTKSCLTTLQHSEKKEQDYFPLMHIAAMYSNISAIEALIAKKCSVRYVSKKYKLDILFCGMQSYSAKFITLLLNCILPLGINVNHSHSVKREPILHFALRRMYNSEIITLLLKHGADPNSVFEGRCPLSFMLQLDCRRILLEWGADPNLDIGRLCPLFEKITAQECLLYLDYRTDIQKWRWDGRSYFNWHIEQGNTNVLLKAYNQLIENYVSTK